MIADTEVKRIYFFGFAGLAASLLVGVGEFLIHYSSSGYSGVVDFLWLRNSSYPAVIMGHYLMLIGLPLYILGYYHFYFSIRTGNEIMARTILVFGIISFMTGGVWAGSRALLTEIVKSGNLSLLDYYKQHYEILVNVMRVFILIISICWTTAILISKTLYPKWMAIVNPILILGLVFVTYFVFPSFGKYLVPTAMNVTHFIFFSLSIFSIYKTTRS